MHRGEPAHEVDRLWDIAPCTRTGLRHCLLRRATSGPVICLVKNTPFEHGRPELSDPSGMLA